MAETMLYGGAMSVCLPNGAKDASEIRQIPDNQEVFMHAQTDQSIIIEIMEHIDEDDQKAIKTHFNDLAEGNGILTEQDSFIVDAERLPEDVIQMSECDSAWYVHGKQNIAKFKEAAKNTVDIHMGLFRLADYSSDILVTFNDPVMIDAASSSNQTVPVHAEHWTIDNFRDILTSLKINDPGLFGAE